MFRCFAAAAATAAASASAVVDRSVLCCRRSFRSSLLPLSLFLAVVADFCSGKYCVAFDPLDGSSNIDCNVSTGTIFAVYDKISAVGGNIADVLRKGTDIKVRLVSGVRCGWVGLVLG